MTFLILLAALAVQDKPFAEGDSAASIAAARKRAAEENRTVLVLWGANDSEKARAAAALLKKDKAVMKLLLYEYDLVLAGGKADAPKVSFPSDDGKPGDMIEAPADAKSWVDLLEQHKRTPLVAKDVLAAGLKKAKAEKKRVLLTFGAPW